jgi:alkylation response protein AidB-like acyl-CoA dehydrogenase
MFIVTHKQRLNMTFADREEYIKLREEVRKFNLRELAPVSSECDEKEVFPFDVLKKASELGYVGPHLPERYGGMGDYYAKAVVYEENCRVSFGYNLSLNASDLLFANNISKHGTEEQKQRYLPPVIKGEKIGCWALTEPDAGSDALSIRTTWRKDGNHYIINGRKTFITNAPIADFFIVIARKPGSIKTDGGCAFILERGMQGLYTGKPFKKLGGRCSPTGEIILDDVKVTRDQLLGEEGNGFKDMFSSLDVERAYTPLSSIGIAQACIDAVVAYSKQRRQFGRYISEFQLIQEKLAVMSAELEVARNYVYNLIELMVHGKRITKEASIAKLFASDMVNKATREAIQIMGGYGYMREYNVERYFRDAKLLEIGAGTSEIQKLIIAKELLK